MSMTDREAAAVLRRVTIMLHTARGNGKSTTALMWSEAIMKAITALEREPRPAIIKGRLFRRRYCPACHERVRRGGRFCRACGQAYREPRPSDYLRAPHIPPSPPRGGAGPHGHSYYLFADGSSADHGGGYII